MMLREWLRGLSRSDLLRDVLRLVSGSLGGRLILLAAMPLVTRLYSPDDFALLAVYMGAVNMGAAIACLRFDVAIPVAHDDKDASHLLVLALLIAGSFAGILLAAIWAAPQAIAGLLGQPRLTPWLWMIPLGILMSANYSALQFWATRTRRFTSMAITRVTQAATGAATMLALGWAGIAPFGLLFGHMLSGSAGSLRLGREALRAGGDAFRQVTRSGLATTFRSYRRFPIYSTPEALANLAGLQVPIMIIAAHAGAEAGYLLLAQQVMAAPLALLGSSIAQVYVSRAPNEMREGRLASFTLSILRRLVLTGVGPLVLVGLAAPFVFPLLFGQHWTRAGEIVAWMVPWTLLQFLASPISMVMFVTSRQRAMLGLTSLGAGVRIGVVLVALPLGGAMLLHAYILASALFYGACLLLFARSAGISSVRIILPGVLVASVGASVYYLIMIFFG